ncbi:MAG TPA: DUF1559 domain-containing protein [Chthonomonadaceae bacterium]|nr:DUF1559 domain-containing protein [Chthonomonadaceae bacterium]
MRRTQRLRRIETCSGFGLIELLVVLVILGLLAALLYPILGKVRERDRASTCMSNLKQIGLAIDLYVYDYDEIYPMSRFPDATHPIGGCTSHNTVQPEDNLQGSSINWKRVLLPYVQRQDIWACPSNPYLWNAGGYNGKQNFGDETNVFYPEMRLWLPISYALNGSFFHEAIPPCWMHEQTVRGRFRSEIQSPANLLLLIETRMSYPDLGDWWIRRDQGGNEPARHLLGPFQTHNGTCNWLCADLHVKSLKLQDTCQTEMWTDGRPSKTGGCGHLDQIAQEYR